MISDKNGIHNFFGYMSLSMEDKLRLIKNAGFDCTSLWGVEADGAGEEDAMSLFRTAESLGLETEFIHAPYELTGYIFEYGTKGEKAYKTIEKNILLCGRLGIPVLVAHITAWHHPKRVTKKGIERLSALTALAEKNGVRMAAENIKLTYALKALDTIDSPFLGFCYDSGHALCFGNQKDPLPDYASRLAALHLHDNDSSRDLHALPGSGKGDWKKTAGIIKDSPYTGALHLEVNADNTPAYASLPPEEFLEKALASLGYIRSLL